MVSPSIPPGRRLHFIFWRMVEQRIYEMENQTATYGTSWELPILLPLTNEKGDITKYMFMISPAPASTADNKAYYFLGDFDLESGRFIPNESYRS